MLHAVKNKQNIKLERNPFWTLLMFFINKHTFKVLFLCFLFCFFRVQCFNIMLHHVGKNKQASFLYLSIMCIEWRHLIPHVNMPGLLCYFTRVYVIPLRWRSLVCSRRRRQEWVKCDFHYNNNNGYKNAITALLWWCHKNKTHDKNNDNCLCITSLFVYSHKRQTFNNRLF